ncbi:SPOR domain-containing protein [Borreliella californiensis]|uniref:Cell division septation protein DedD n=1 Tax=Borreliella californiensis TaxID=373543 RepID=A0A7W9ZJH5_9SPIR|nr:SPOR domain-containing protein [Borreliella californiensis]MBB6212661.1 cell division septation protein DedD [Borreliella californiensis]WKC91816.1 SPOR domain-containing protein [Borreliella californiensis]WNY70568.1 SPOR domain-containing protein [Borreliella californiensis]
MKDLNENNDNNKGFFVALTSIATVCIIIFLGTIIFFPNKNLASDIAEKNIILEEEKDQNTLENVDQNEKSLKVSETQNEIIIDLTQDLNKEKTPANKTTSTSQKSKTIKKPQSTTQKIPNTSQKSKTIEKPQSTTQKIPNTSQKSKPIEKPQSIAQKPLNIDNIYDPNTEYYIQFVSLSDPINADNYIQKLLKYNIVAKIYSATVDNKDIYRVRSGPYKTKSEAKAEFKKIAGIGEFKETYILPVNK